jgi:metal-dependent amidase/aminoacylase/carboxypeptidase family protein
MIMAYTAINALRQHISEKSSIHVIITAGGEAANIVPAYTSAKFIVRCADMDYLEELKGKVLDCFQGAAVATGSRLEYRWGDVVYAPMNNNYGLACIFHKNMQSLRGSIEPLDAVGRLGSTDMGNVSQVIPSIHPTVAIVRPGISLHTGEFATAAVSDTGHQALIDGAIAMAMTAADLLCNSDVLKSVKEEFNQSTYKEII